MQATASPVFPAKPPRMKPLLRLAMALLAPLLTWTAVLTTGLFEVLPIAFPYEPRRRAVAVTVEPSRVVNVAIASSGDTVFKSVVKHKPVSPPTGSTHAPGPPYPPLLVILLGAAPHTTASHPLPVPPPLPERGGVTGRCIFLQPTLPFFHKEAIPNLDPS